MLLSNDVFFPSSSRAGPRPLRGQPILLLSPRVYLLKGNFDRNPVGARRVLPGRCVASLFAFCTPPISSALRYPETTLLFCRLPHVLFYYSSPESSYEHRSITPSRVEGEILPLNRIAGLVFNGDNMRLHGCKTIIARTKTVSRYPAQHNHSLVRGDPQHPAFCTTTTVIYDRALFRRYPLSPTSMNPMSTNSTILLCTMV